MSDLVVKDNALMNASYNLSLVEQRLILLAIIEARGSGKGINANNPLVVHAESYINQFGVAKQTAYQALKDACKDLFARQFSYQEKRGRGTINITSRWVSQVGYIDDLATVELIFSPAVVPVGINPEFGVNVICVELPIPLHDPKYGNPNCAEAIEVPVEIGTN